MPEIENSSSQYFPTHDDDVVDNDDNVEDDFNDEDAADLKELCLLPRYSWTCERQSSLIICGEKGNKGNGSYLMMMSSSY